MKQLRKTCPWVPDLGDGNYLNPVIHADYSDPDVIRHGDDFYLTSSSFNCVPGLPILHSRDLVNWRIVNHALRSLPHPRYSEVQHGQGVWAPAIRHHADRFWIVFPTPDEGIYVTTAEHPESKWSEPHLLLGGKGLIDPCLLWDDDGKTYLVHAYAGSRAGIRNKLHVRPVSPDARETFGQGKIVASIDEKQPALEGPKWLKRNGWYYISAPSGGVQTGWQTILRSRNVYGPYEEKIVLAQRGTPINGPHQGALVDTPDGEWWFVHFQDVGLYGRVVHLQPVRWEDDWPLIGIDQDENGVGKPVLKHSKPVVRATSIPAVPQTSDDFRAAELGMQWQWHSNHRDDWYSLKDRPGNIRLFPQFVRMGDFSTAGNLLLQKFPAREFVVETKLEMPSGHENLHAGLIVMGQEHAALDVTRGEADYKVRLLGAFEESEVHTITESSVTLQVRVGHGGACRFGLIQPTGDFHQIGPEFFARPGRWIGAKVGLYCMSTNLLDLSGNADFDYFRVVPVAEPIHSTAIEHLTGMAYEPKREATQQKFMVTGSMTT